MLRARFLKAIRIRNKAAAKAAKLAAAEAAEAAANGVVMTNTANNVDANNAADNPEVDSLTCAHQRAITAVATLIQVDGIKKGRKEVKHLYSDPILCYI